VYRALSTANIRPLGINEKEKNFIKKHNFKQRMKKSSSISHEMFAQKSGSVNINLPIDEEKDIDDE
jgi:hypothetical protein